MEEQFNGTENAGVAMGVAGNIKNVGVLDLTSMKTPEEIARITSIENVGALLVPASLASALGAVPSRSVGTTVAVPEGNNVKVLTGELHMSGEALADASSDEVLLNIGQLIVTSRIDKIGYKSIIVVGELIAPAGSESAVGAAIGQLTGSTIYYPLERDAAVRTLPAGELTPQILANKGGSEADTLLVLGDSVITAGVDKIGYRHVASTGMLLAPKESQDLLSDYLWASSEIFYYGGKIRRFTGFDSFSNDFLELLDGSVTLVLMGKFTFEGDVTREMLKSKVSEIVLTGAIEASKNLVPLLQVLTVQRKGKISAFDEDAVS